MDEHRFNALARRASFKALAAAGASLLGAAALADGAAARKRKRKRCACPKSITTRLEISTDSAPLAADAGSQVATNADCGGPNRVVSCGYQTAGNAAQFVNAVINGVGPTSDRSQSVAFLLRTSATGATAGATIQATALCQG
jgi:hypothetical protein